MLHHLHDRNLKLEEVLFESALDFTDGKRVEAARALGVGRNTLTRKLKDKEEVIK